MDTTLLLPIAFFGIRFGFTLIVASILFALFPFSAAFRRIAPLTLVVATLIGTLSAILFLCSGTQEEIPIVFVRSVPWLIFNLNTLSALFILLINSVALLCSWYSLRYVDLITKNLRESKIMHAQTGVFVLGMLGSALASTPLGFLFFWELMSFASFFLVMSDKKEASQNAALFYLAMTQLGALSIAAGFAIAMGGNMVAPFSVVLSIDDPKLLIAFLLLFVGFGSKAGLLPLHAWLPKAHPQAPSHISALMSGAMLKVALYGFILVVVKVLPPLPAAYGAMVTTIGLLTAVFAVLHAAAEKEMKTLLAWSSVENMGLLFAMVGTALFASAAGPSWLVPIAIAAAIFLAFNHAFFKSGLFLAAGVLAHEMHVHNLEEMGGLAKRMPKFSKWVFLLAIAAAALPPFGAFFAEWTFLRGLLAGMSGSGVSLPAGIFYLFIFVTVGFVGGIAVFAMTKFFGIAFLGEPRTEAASHSSEPSAVFFRGPLMLALLGKSEPMSAIFVKMPPAMRSAAAPSDSPIAKPMKQGPA
jgi:formate hydrogenlyase subunit 3/multisubunit Na+/H+ antiporter MnhD subunit